MVHICRSLRQSRHTLSCADGSAHRTDDRDTRCSYWCCAVGAVAQLAGLLMHPLLSNPPLDLAAARQRLTKGFPLVDDHPDVAGVLRDPDLLALIGQALAHPFADEGITAVVSPEARGPIVGALAATWLGAGLVLVRKDDENHPGADIEVTSEPTWQGRTEGFLGRSFDLGPKDRVLIVDDWITTGSSIRVCRDILKASGALFVGSAVVVNKTSPATLEELKVHYLVDFDRIGA